MSTDSLETSQESENSSNSPKIPVYSEFTGSYLPMNFFSREREIVGSFQSLRIIQKNLVYIIGLSRNFLNQEEYLTSFECLGQYGKVVKLVINKSKTYNDNGPNGPSFSCYATFSSIDESSLAILALDGAIVDGHTLKASYGTTKYCTNFLRNSICLNKDCLYLHRIANEKEILSRNEMINNKSIFASQLMLAIELSKVLTSEKKKRFLEGIRYKKTLFPNAFSVYKKDIVKEYIKMHNLEDVFENKIKENKIKINRGIKKLYQSRNKSRFDFVNKKIERKGEDEENGCYSNSIKVPDIISNFITYNFNRTFLFKGEQDEIIEYYFSSKKSNDSKDIWSFLIKTLKLYSEFDYTSSKQFNGEDSLNIFDKLNV